MRLDGDRLKTGLLLTAAVGLAILGQFYFFQRREYVWDAVIFVTIALVCFARLLRRGRERPTMTTLWRERARQLVKNPQILLVGLALLSNLLAARSANASPPPTDYTGSVLLWLASLVLLFATFTLLPPRNTHPQSTCAGAQCRWLRSRNPLFLADSAREGHASRPTPHELPLILTLLFIGLLLRLWNLGYVPANLGGDEGTQGLWAVDVLRGRLRNPFSTGWFTVPTMSFFAQAASLRLFGDDIAGLRTLSALVGTATLAFTYLLARRNLGPRVALFALIALTFNHYHIHFSRLGSNQIADPLFITLALWLLTKALRRSPSTPNPLAPARSADGSAPETHSSWQTVPRKVTHHASRNTLPWFLATGLTVGLSWYGYFGSRVILLVVALYLVARGVAEKGFLRRHAPGLALLALAAFMAVSPLLLHYADHPENLSARFNQVNFFRWLKSELARPDHDSPLALIIRQIWRSISAFNHTLDPTFWYHAEIPLLDFVSGILFLLGIVVAFSQWRRPAVRLVLIWFGLALTLGWILTENPPSSMRMVIVSPAVAILVALGLHRLLGLTRRLAGGRRFRWTQAGLALMAVAAALNVQYYFFVYAPKRVYGNPTAETGTVLGRYLASRGDQVPVHFYGPPFMYYDSGVIRFIARDVPGVSVPPRDQNPDYHTRVSGPALFVVLPERLNELPAIQSQHRGGHLQEFYSDASDRLLFILYEVPP